MNKIIKFLIDPRKVILTIVLLVIPHYFFPCFGTDDTSLGFALYIIYIPSSLFLDTFNLNITATTFYLVITMQHYIVSCLTFGIYDKLKEKFPNILTYFLIIAIIILSVMIIVGLTLLLNLI